MNKNFINKLFCFFEVNRKTLTIVGCLGLMILSTTVMLSYIVNATESKKKLPIYSVETDKKQVAISFDAAWGIDDTGAILQILSEEDIIATFFVCGYWVEKYPEIVQQVYDAGHEIGNHGATHAHVAQLSKEQLIKEIKDAHDIVKETIGLDMIYFRPPYGEYNNNVIETAEELGYKTIQWSVDSHDWMDKSVEYEVNQVLNNKNLQNGTIILFHKFIF